MFWGVVAGVIVLVGAMVALFDQPDGRVTIAGTMALGGFAVWLHLRSWRRPERELARRLPSFPALDRTAARREKLSRVTWGNLALGPVFAVVLASRAWGDGGGVQGWTALWIAAGVALVVVSAVQAWRKWRMERLG